MPKTTRGTATEDDPLHCPNCPNCLRPMEAVEVYGGVAMWACGYGCDEEV